jgi:uncharacterized protein (DUF305 family)
MRTRWIGVAGVASLLLSLVLGAVGPRLWPAAFWGNARAGMMSGGMMQGMMNGGMMNGGMMGQGMMNGMMSPGVTPDRANQPFDQRWLDEMIMHHQHAVMSSSMMIADSERPELRDLAERIISAQGREIDQMRQWRRDWYGAGGMADVQGAMMTQMMGNRGAMRAQMQQMMGNVDLDRMFLEMMIPHHEDAIAMAEQALAEAEHAELKNLAQTIIATQQAEIDEMRGYLRDWYGVSQ